MTCKVRAVRTCRHQGMVYAGWHTKVLVDSAIPEPNFQGQGGGIVSDVSNIRGTDGYANHSDTPRNLNPSRRGAGDSISSAQEFGYGHLRKANGAPGNCSSDRILYQQGQWVCSAHSVDYGAVPSITPENGILIRDRSASRAASITGQGRGTSDGAPTRICRGDAGRVGGCGFQHAAQQKRLVTHYTHRIFRVCRFSSCRDDRLLLERSPESWSRLPSISQRHPSRS